MSEFITIKQASEITGKHPDTIRHLIRKHKSSKHITKDSKGRVLIDLELINREYSKSTPTPQKGSEQAPETHTPNHTSDSEKLPSKGLEAVIQALTSQLEAKDKQIEGLQQIIHEKESNQTKLSDQFQQMLAMQQLPTNTYNQEADNLIKPETQNQSRPVKKNPKKTSSSSKPSTKKTQTKKAKSAPIKNTEAPKKKRWWGRA